MSSWTNKTTVSGYVMVSFGLWLWLSIDHLREFLYLHLLSVEP